MMLLLCLTMILFSIVLYMRWVLNYWKRRGLQNLETSIPFGTMERSFSPKLHHAETLNTSYEELKKRGEKHGGIYNFLAPGYLPISPEFIRNILQRDFNYFTDRGIYYNETDDPLSAHLYALGGKQWRNLRTKLTPTLTAAKIKMMINTLLACSADLENTVQAHTKKKEALHIKDLVAHYTTDVIGSCAFGLDVNSFKDTEAEFRKYGKKLTEPSAMRLLRRFVLLAAPEVGRLLKMRILPKDITDFFLNVVKETVRYREENNIYRMDMLQLLIDMKNNNNNNEENQDSLSIEQVAAQAFVFFGAGFETTSTTMSYCLYELSRNQCIQDKVRHEISTVLSHHDGHLTYEAVLDMKYFYQVLEETLRKYPPLPEITRKCVQDYNVPNTDVVIEKGTLAFIPILSIHYDPEYYPEPETFDPERFSPENKKTRVPYTYLPFGEGPRICLGARFAMIEAIIGLAPLIKNYKFSLSNKTQTPLKLDPKNFILSSSSTIWLESENVTN